MYGSSMTGRKPRPSTGVPLEYIDPTAARGRKQYRGNYFADPELVDVQTLEYNMRAATDDRGKPMKTTKSWTFVRILPTLDELDPERWAPAAYPGQDVGQWLQCFQMFKGGKNKQIKMILWDPNDPDYDRRQNPAQMLRWNIEQAHKKGVAQPGWERLIFNKQKLQELGLAKPGADSPTGDSFGDYNAPLAYAKPSFFVRALVFRRGDVYCEPIQGLDEGDKVPMLDLGSDAGRKLVLNVAEHGYDMDLGGEAYHVFYRRGDDPFAKEDRFRDLSGPGGYDVARWAMDFDLAAYEPLLARKLVPFSSVFRIMEDGQQAELLAQAFDLDVLEYGWRERKEYLDIARAVHRRTTTAEVPAAAPRPFIPAPAAAATPPAPHLPRPEAKAAPSGLPRELGAAVAANYGVDYPQTPAPARAQWTPPTPPAPADPAPADPAPAAAPPAPAGDARERARRKLAEAREKIRNGAAPAAG